MRKSLIIAGIVVLVTVAGALVVWRIVDRPMDTPVEAVPEQVYSVADVTFFLQNDPQWAGDTLGDSRFKMSGSGCLVSCIASSLDAQGIDTDPGRLNEAFTEHEVYNSEGEILWNNIANAFPSVEATLPARVDAADIEKALAEGLFPIVKIKYRGSGYQHWVLIIGADEDGYLCMDPMNAGKEPLPLSEHGGVIYRYRIVTVNDTNGS